MDIPTDRRYLASHEWHKPEGELVVIGLSEPGALDREYTGARRLTVREADVHAADAPVTGVHATERMQAGDVAGLADRELAEPGVIAGRGGLVSVVSFVHVPIMPVARLRARGTPRVAVLQSRVNLPSLTPRPGRARSRGRSELPL